MHANIEFSSHSNHHHLFFPFFILLLLLLPMPANALPSSSHTIKNEFFFLVPLMLYHLQWIDGWKRSEWDGMKSICVFGWMYEEHKTLLKFPYDIYPNLLSWGFSYFYILFKKKSLLCIFFCLYCYVADCAAATAAYIDGNRTWKLSPMNWLLCVYVNVNLFISLFLLLNEKKGMEYLKLIFF